MNRLLPTAKLEESSLTYEDLYKYIEKKSKIKWKREDILFTLFVSSIIYIEEEGKVVGILVYRQNHEGHHIHFLAAENRKRLKEIVLRGLKEGVWPKTAERRQKRKIYSRPDKLIERLLKY